MVMRPQPAFGHAVEHRLANGQTLIGCYHPSRQNTNTGKLTPAMIDDVFHLAQRRLSRRVAKARLNSGVRL
jgi:uracil-DNA glycosylase